MLGIRRKLLTERVAKNHIGVCFTNGGHRQYAEDMLETLSEQVQKVARKRTRKPPVRVRTPGLTTGQVARLLRVTQKTVRIWVAMHYVEATTVKNSTHSRISPASIAAITGELLPGDIIMVPREVAAHFRVNRSTIEEWTARGMIDAMQLPSVRHLCRYVKRRLPAPFDSLDEPVLSKREVAAKMGKSEDWIDYWVQLYQWRVLRLPTGITRYLQSEVERAAKKQ